MASPPLPQHNGFRYTSYHPPCASKIRLEGLHLSWILGLTVMDH